MIGALDFRVCQETVRAARASFAALSSVLSNVALSDALADRLRALAPGGQAAAGLMRVAYEPFRHGAVAVIEGRLTPGDLYLDFVAALISECRGLHVRHDHGWPVLSRRSLAAAAGVGEAAA